MPPDGAMTDAPGDASTVLPADELSALGAGVPMEERKHRLGIGATKLVSSVTPDAMPRDERVRLAVAGALVALGVLMILLAWAGTSRSIVVAEQIPYLISGGLLGLSLTIAGGVGYFAHWQRVARREAERSERDAERHHQELIAALASRDATPNQREEVVNGIAPRVGAERPLRRPARRSRR